MLSFVCSMVNLIPVSITDCVEAGKLMEGKADINNEAIESPLSYKWELILGQETYKETF